ncbi:hypothetical protein OEZ85_006930 [Tetradesmus obliquus]|uniref:Fibronectin type-III domain-containing protein n=1 Tax=Tetradesmus obliquus TaxID=3088 RepID=A0ABY8TW25_TETOB|nr:hypothetical protein OEZ85_006930 [Tetradesmus obliquus]
MPPKKDKKDEKKEEPEDKVQAELAALQGAKQDMELGHAILVDKLRQCKAENDRLLQEIDNYKARITNATQDYVDILQHREEQIKAADARAGTLQQQLDKLQAEIAQKTEEIAKLKEVNASQAERLEDAASMVSDKERLEDTVKKQHDLIEQRGAEIKVSKAQIDSKDAALEKARSQIEELSLRCQATTQLRVLFGEVWLVQTTHVKLKGSVPHDREYNVLAATAGGKQLVLHGGQSRTHESVARETAVLSLDTLQWEQPETAVHPTGLLAHTATVTGRNKLMVFGGSTGEDASAAATVLSTDTMRWSSITANGLNQPPPRLSHAAAALRDKVYIFGGMTIDGHLLNDLWALDLDSMTWSHCTCYGLAPSARKGASLCATEDGRRLYLVGGHDGRTLLNDCYYLEVERLMWSQITPSGPAPEPREQHVAAVLGKYLFITGGCSEAPAAAAAAGAGSLAAAGGDAAAAVGGMVGKRLTDTYVLDMYTGPAWEQLDDGAWGNNLVWLKQMSVNSVMHGSRLFTLRPNLHEQLEELMVMELTLPEDIERMKTAKRRDKEQVNVLELLSDAAATSSSLEVSWRPPSKNSERITGYKLMVATSTGVAREVFQGKGLSYTVTGLKPAAEYVFCVKATYDDGSFVWSESKAFTTKS